MVSENVKLAISGLLAIDLLLIIHLDFSLFVVLVVVMVWLGVTSLQHFLEFFQLKNIDHIRAELNHDQLLQFDWNMSLK